MGINILFKTCLKMPKLHYFNIWGAAENIRMALTYCGVEFENVAHEGEEFANEFKPKCEFGQMPVYELDDGTMMAQTMPIFNYVCDVHGAEKGLAPTDPMVRFNADCTVAVL